MSAYEEEVLQHYREQALNHQLRDSSTMPDEIVRDRELASIRSYLSIMVCDNANANLLDIGCGNGHLLSVLRYDYPGLHLWGIDFCKEMVDLASSRKLPDAIIAHGDARNLAFEMETFDFVVSERVIINLLDVDDQRRAFAEVFRVLKPGGYFICIEAFATPLANINKARRELCLPSIEQPGYNRWFTDDDFASFLNEGFEIWEPSRFGERGKALPEPNCLSTHYFVSRVVHDSIRQPGGTVRNTRFVEFFSEVLPPYGDYAPVKVYLLRRTK